MKYAQNVKYLLSTRTRQNNRTIFFVCGKVKSRSHVYWKYFWAKTH